MGVHVGLNLIFLVPGETGGMEVAARELIPALIERAPADMRFTAFVNREAAESPGGPWRTLLPAVIVPVHARDRVQWVVGEQTLLPVLAARAGVDLVHSMASTAPLWGAFRRVVTIHDLIYARYPEAHAGIRDKGMRVLVPAAARRAQRVIVDSEATRKDLLSLTRVRGDAVDVVPLGLGAVLRDAALDPEATRARFELGQREIVLTLSAMRPHKNLVRLIEALALIEPSERPLLVLPGYSTWHAEELQQRAREAGVEQDVRFLGWIDGPALEGLWALARAFVFPSLYEGFGLPVLEAMSRGVPVACSNASSLPEVAGDAALLFDPTRTQDIAAAILRLLRDPAEAVRLAQQGRRRAALFTWERTAELTLASYERALARE